uniref:Ankyrin repeat protein n=1 Tax=Marseillevirus LCMAC101 TaxID=2506602 RepID=A0A481YS76_9VIRU|nr:MAG: ankyrin repeat protein [Marseillevirus LCMAC101]
MEVEIFYLIKENNNITLRKCLEQDKDLVNCRDRLGKYPINEACKRGNLGAARILVEYGANVKQMDKSYSPLMEACGNDNIDLVRFLVGQGANLDDKGGWKDETPLIYSCKYISDINIDIVVFLIEKGADPNDQSNQNETALWFVCEKHNLDAGRILLNAGANLDFCSEDKTTERKGRCERFIKEVLNVGKNIKRADS